MALPCHVSRMPRNHVSSTGFSSPIPKRCEMWKSDRDRTEPWSAFKRCTSLSYASVSPPRVAMIFVVYHYQPMPLSVALSARKPRHCVHVAAVNRRLLSSSSVRRSGGNVRRRVLGFYDHSTRLSASICVRSARLWMSTFFQLYIHTYRHDVSAPLYTYSKFQGSLRKGMKYTPLCYEAI
ncbi:hypothetical protein K458DRAFT_404627 [Lentithecium fluviatile CBS 122367]|uniref:Uncharacterized protein n=1 Tax=Lentithecium fluviatile CBS 122367 TaxID=1168545 RepID=A0A6G1IZJ2_9PLEO|nr:hypothetical protein K458DRAFT_404627 [Lentithecium fluviatile CBS 122367]